MEKDLKIGHAVWYVPDGHLLAIRCKIIYIDYEFRNKHPDGFLFYDIDEPVGHDLYTEEFLTKSTAIRELKLDYDEYQLWEKEDRGKNFIKRTGKNASLAEYRKSRINFIVSTWELTASQEKVERERLWQLYPPKRFGVEWFNLQWVIDDNRKRKV